eukprot:3584828-Rhodomonas_salina.1
MKCLHATSIASDTLSCQNFAVVMALAVAIVNANAANNFPSTGPSRSKSYEPGQFSAKAAWCLRFKSSRRSPVMLLPPCDCCWDWLASGNAVCLLTGCVMVSSTETWERV